MTCVTPWIIQNPTQVRVFVLFIKWCTSYLVGLLTSLQLLPLPFCVTSWGHVNKRPFSVLRAKLRTVDLKNLSDQYILDVPGIITHQYRQKLSKSLQLFLYWQEIESSVFPEGLLYRCLLLSCIKKYFLVLASFYHLWWWSSYVAFSWWFLILYSLGAFITIGRWEPRFDLWLCLPRRSSVYREGF